MTDAKKPVCILAVDDEPTITEFVSHALKSEGYLPETASSAEEALVLAEHNHYDLFILDVMLPGMNGYDLCRRIRSFSSAPVLFLSAYSTELDKVVGLEIGADDYLPKPFGVREFIARVRALLREAWGWEYLTYTKSVDTHVKRLRNKIQASGHDPKLVETVRGVSVTKGQGHLSRGSVNFP